MLKDVMGAIVAERTESKGDSKHYIPFTKPEWEKVRAAFGRPDMKPNDLKLVILAIIEGKVKLESVKPAATASEPPKA